jgi:hypothetical protein
MANGSEGLRSRMEDISWGGQRVDPKTGNIIGQQKAHHVQPEPMAGGASYILALPPASAVLLVVPRPQE